MWEWIRYRALILAVLPFVLAGSLWLLSATAAGWDRLSFTIIFILSMPFLAVMAAFSVVYAFRKNDDLRRLEGTSKVASIVSLVVFGGLILVAAAGMIQSLWF